MFASLLSLSLSLSLSLRKWIADREASIGVEHASSADYTQLILYLRSNFNKGDSMNIAGGLQFESSLKAVARKAPSLQFLVRTLTNDSQLSAGLVVRVYNLT